MTFQQFLKANHAWSEFVNEVITQSVYPNHEQNEPTKVVQQITDYTQDPTTRNSILEDGNFFFYTDATTLIDWFELDMKWREKC